jgi:Ca2+-binding RTX toxin-like protein
VIVDANDSGNDTVKSAASFSLAAPTLMNGQIENLVLLGTKNLHGTGNALNNEMLGNSGNNVIDAGAGMDEIKGGKGDDTFIFATGHETDSISDFGHGADKIDLSGCADIHGFKDLMKNHVTEDKGNVYIDSGMTDELILEHHTKADLSEGQFIF